MIKVKIINKDEIFDRVSNKIPYNNKAKNNTYVEPIKGNVERNLFAGINTLTIPTIINAELSSFPLVILHPLESGHFFLFSRAVINCVKYIHNNVNNKLNKIRIIVKNENILLIII